MKKLFYISNLLTLCLVLASVSAKAQAPTVTSDPRDTTVCANVIAKFMITATNATAQHCQESADCIS